MERAELVRCLKHVSSFHPVVETQRELVDLLRHELREDGHDPGYLDPRRIRRLAIVEGIYKVRIKCATRSDPPRYRKCPVCGEQVSRLDTMDLFGKVRKTHIRCDTCGFWTGKRRRVPCRYMFSRH